MPTLILRTNLTEIETELESLLHQDFRHAISNTIGKSQEFVLSIIDRRASMQFGTNNEPAAYCELKNVGILNPQTTSQLTQLICSIITQYLNISSRQIYIEFQESERHLWGWNGKTFAQ